ncbi:MAG: glycerol-3-phosphate 1-O-acyltransferase PlsY [Gammaproteobacteria bacterium]
MLIVYFLSAYLLGSISSAILVCRALGEADPRGSGSGNPGATNVLRQSGKFAAALTLAGDVAKGFVPVVLGTLNDAPPMFIAALGAGAFIGHLYPIFFQFKGGKGVATIIGVLFGITPLLGMAFVLSWLAVAAVTRYSSLSALIAAACSPAVAWLLHIDIVIVATLGVMVVILFWRHQGNIRKLMAGEESKIGRSKR